MTRNPEGKFISRDAMLHVWLPKMLGWLYREPLETMLTIAARWCSLRIVNECNLQARYLEEHDERTLWLAPVDRIAHWKQRREILLQTITELRKIDRVEF